MTTSLSITVVAEAVSHPLIINDVDILPVLTDRSEASVRHFRCKSPQLLSRPSAVAAINFPLLSKVLVATSLK